MKQYVVDAFTDKVFRGNPAAVCVMDQWLPDETLAKIAMENNLAETAFAVKEGEDYRLRWFTPGEEIDLCGHATLAAGSIVLTYYEPERTSVTFHTLSGPLHVTKKGDLFEMDLPAYQLAPTEITPKMVEVLGIAPQEAYMGRDLLCVFQSEEEVRALKLDPAKVKELPGLLLQVTGPGKEYDCVSRTFGPKVLIDEDHVCGSGHCHFTPFWANRLNKNALNAFQASPRTGVLYCTLDGSRVRLAGNTALYSVAELFID